MERTAQQGPVMQTGWGLKARTTGFHLLLTPL